MSAFALQNDPSFALGSRNQTVIDFAIFMLMNMFVFGMRGNKCRPSVKNTDSRARRNIRHSRCLFNIIFNLGIYIKQ